MPLLAINGVNHQNEDKHFELGGRRHDRQNKIPEEGEQICNFRGDHAAQSGG